MYSVPALYYAALGSTMQISRTHEPDPGDAYYEWLSSLAREQYIPQRISVGWRFKEQNIQYECAEALCEVFIVLGGRGISVFAALDVGAAGNCRDNSFYTTFPTPCTCGF